MSKADQRAELARLMAASAQPIRQIPPIPQGEPEIPQKPVKPSKPKRIKRNWAAQRRYDEAHGTVNGYDERLENMRAMRKRGAGDY